MCIPIELQLNCVHSIHSYSPFIRPAAIFLCGKRVCPSWKQAKLGQMN